VHPFGVHLCGGCTCVGCIFVAVHLCGVHICWVHMWRMFPDGARGTYVACTQGAYDMHTGRM